MNAGEGMRRVAILVGLLGGITGAAIGYSDLRNLWSSHKEFERLEALPVMQDAARAVKAYPISGEPPRGRVGIPGMVPMIGPDGSTGEIPKNRVQEALNAGGRMGIWAQSSDGSAKIVPAPPESIGFSSDGVKEVFVIRQASGADKISDPAAEVTVDVGNQDGILTVDADKSGAISAIQLTTGQWVHREPHTAKSHFTFIAPLILPFCYPVIGFLFPWVMIKLLVWVGSGFFQPTGSA
jgi:hypothetical protein